MKREYTKPDILFESFSLSSSIAGNCEVKTHLPTQDSCGLAYGWETIFTDRWHGCTETYPSGISQATGYNGLCYHNPSETYNLFRS